MHRLPLRLPAKNRLADLSANFLIGCDPVSPGCKFCYAANLALIHTQRRQYDDYCSDKFARPVRGLGRWNDHGEWTGRIAYLPHRVRKFLEKHGGRRSGGFVQTCMTSDLFAEGIPFFVIDQIFAVFMLRPRLMFYVTTKRSSRMAEYAQYAIAQPAAYWERLMLHWEPDTDMLAPEFPLNNLILGPSVENDSFLFLRAPSIASAKLVAALSVIAAEPIIGPLNLAAQLRMQVAPDWIVASGEHFKHGPKVLPREAHEHFFSSLIDTCKTHGIPIWIANLGNNFVCRDGSRPEFKSTWGSDPTEWPQELHVRQMPTHGLIFSEPVIQRNRQRKTCKLRRRKP
jgi:protein gp37